MPKKEVVLIGAGKIGRGFMGDLFNRAGYKLIFLEYSEDLVKKMNAQGYYTVFMSDRDSGGSGEMQQYTIGGYDAYCTETERDACVNAIANTNYATMHVYPQACESIGHMIGDAVKQRMAANNEEPLDIFMCVNFQGPAETIHGYAFERLNEEEKAFFDKHVGLIETLIQRNGATPTEEMLQIDPICVAVSDNTYWPVDEAAFKGVPPEGIDLTMLDNFQARLVYKVWAGNMTHCAGAFYGKQRGYEYYYQSALDPYIYKCSYYAKLEANFGISSEYNVPVEKLDSRGNGKMAPFDPSKVNTQERDSLNRIGADPIRKLRRNDRWIGPALLSMKYGKVPYFLCRGAAMGFYFTNPDDTAAVELQDYIANEGIAKAVEKYCELDLSVPNEKVLYDLILASYYEIGDADPFTAVY